MPIPRIAITPGEPAGVGPDLLLMIAQNSWSAELIAIADEDMLARRAANLGLPITLRHFNSQNEPLSHIPSTLCVYPISLLTREKPGVLDKTNSSYVLETIKAAVDGCKSGSFSAIVTGPVQKSVICEAGFSFSGHTEFIAELTASENPVMLLAAKKLKVALATTHIPLKDVSANLTTRKLVETIRTLNNGLITHFGISEPEIAVLGLNPHAGEDGFLGLEEISMIKPAIEEMQALGLNITGPLPADTAFTREYIGKTDAYLAMYHDQGLPILKYIGFGASANITLGLPFYRSSVDHGTALKLAGSTTPRPNSLRTAIEFAINSVTY